MAGLIIAFIVSLLVAVGWIYFFWKIDKYEKEPLKPLIITFFLGALTIIPVAITELIGEKIFNFGDINNPNFLSLFVYLVLVVGFTEEFAKFAVVRFYSFKQKAFNEPFDGLVYASASAAGFLFVEDIMYIFGAFNVSFAEGLVMTYARVIFSPVHILFASYWGLELGLCKKNPVRKGQVYKNLLLASFLHGLYDFFALTGLVLPLFITIGIMVYLLAKKIKFAQRISPFSKKNYLVECIYCKAKIKPNVLYCGNCGASTEWLDKMSPLYIKYFCGNCGSQIEFASSKCENCGEQIIWK